MAVLNELCVVLLIHTSEVEKPLMHKSMIWGCKGFDGGVEAG